LFVISPIKAFKILVAILYKNTGIYPKNFLITEEASDIFQLNKNC